VSCRSSHHCSTPILRHFILPFANMDRRIEPELLDALPADDPRAIRSRRDLRRLNSLMGNVRLMTAALRTTVGERPPGQIVDLGAGDGTFMLRVAQRLFPCWQNVEMALLDRRGIVSAQTRRQFERLSWSVNAIEADVADWLAQPSSDRVDVMTSNLFLHHFSESSLAWLMQRVAEQTACFVACEPRRYPVALRATRWLRLIGCNWITRHDARASVRAGFNGQELSRLWPRGGDWQWQEKAAGLFSHCFVARRLGGEPSG